MQPFSFFNGSPNVNPVSSKVVSYGQLTALPYLEIFFQSMGIKSDKSVTQTASNAINAICASLLVDGHFAFDNEEEDVFVFFVEGNKIANLPHNRDESKLFQIKNDKNEMRTYKLRRECENLKAPNRLSLVCLSESDLEGRVVVSCKYKYPDLNFFAEGMNRIRDELSRK